MAASDMVVPMADMVDTDSAGTTVSDMVASDMAVLVDMEDTEDSVMVDSAMVDFITRCIFVLGPQ